MNEVNETKYKVGYLYKLSWVDEQDHIITISECIRLAENDSMIVDDVLVIQGNTSCVDEWHWGPEDERASETCIKIGKKDEHPEYYL